MKSIALLALTMAFFAVSSHGDIIRRDPELGLPSYTKKDECVCPPTVGISNEEDKVVTEPLNPVKKEEEVIVRNTPQVSDSLDHLNGVTMFNSFHKKHNDDKGHHGKKDDDDCVIPEPNTLFLLVFGFIILFFFGFFGGALHNSLRK